MADLGRFARRVVGAGNDRRAFPRRLRHLSPARPGRTGRFRPRPRRASEESDFGRASGSGSGHFRDSPFRVALPRFAVAPAGADAEDDDRKKCRKTGPVGGGAPLPGRAPPPRPATPGSGCGRTRSGGDRGRSRPPVPPRTEGLRERPPRPPVASGSLPAESGLGGVQEQNTGARVEGCPGGVFRKSWAGASGTGSRDSRKPERGPMRKTTTGRRVGSVPGRRGCAAPSPAPRSLRPAPFRSGPGGGRLRRLRRRSEAPRLRVPRRRGPGCPPPPPGRWGRRGRRNSARRRGPRVRRRSRR